MPDVKINPPNDFRGPPVVQSVAMPAYQNPADRAHVQFLKEQQISRSAKSSFCRRRLITLKQVRRKNKEYALWLASPKVLSFSSGIALVAI